MSLSNSNREKKEKIGHILAACIILVHAYEKYDLDEHNYAFFIVAGTVFSLVAVFHHRIAKIFPYVDGVFFVIEALVYAVIAAEYFHLGKKALPWCYVFAAIAYLVAAILKGKKGSKNHLAARALNKDKPGNSQD